MGRYHFKLPDIGEGVVEAEITAWHVALGDRIEEDAPIADAMTDKATIELTAPVSGIITSMACEEGEMLAVGGVLVEFEIEGEGNVGAEPAASSAVDSTDTPSHPKSPALERTQAQAPVAKTPTPQPGLLQASPPQASPPQASPPQASLKTSSGKALASPAVRKRAADLGLDLSKVPASGSRVTHADLDAYLIGGATAPASPQAPRPAPPPPPVQAAALSISDPIAGETRHKVIGLRRVIATRMAESKRAIPHFTYVDEIDMTALEAMRKRANSDAKSDRPKLTVLPLLIRAMAVTLKDWPQFNARYEDAHGFVSRFEDFNLGLATQTDGGLIVPVIQQAQSRTIWQLAAEIARLAEGARNNSLSLDDLSGATTTLTSLGPLGGIVTTPVINRPEVAIFGPNKIRDRVALDDGQVTVRKVMNFSISCDHRVIDGYDAAAMLQDLKARLEDPASIFLL